VSGDQGDILGPWPNHWTGGQETSSRVSHWAAENGSEDIAQGQAPSKTKEETFKARPSEKNKDDSGTPGLARTLSGNGSR
jgi:hypothetical protein